MPRGSLPRRSIRSSATRSGAIAVTLILPSAVNTPFFDHALSKTGLKPKPIAPVYARQWLGAQEPVGERVSIARRDEQRMPPLVQDLGQRADRRHDQR